MAEVFLPKLCCIKPLQNEFSEHSVIEVNSPKFTIGRSLSNTEVIACVAISRSHCVLQQAPDLAWTIRDTSRYGTMINGHRIKQNEDVLLRDRDIIQLDLAGDFVYKFYLNSEPDPPSRKRKHHDSECPSDVGVRIKDAKDKFDFTQNIEMDNMLKKLNTAKRKHMDIMNEKQLLQKNLHEKISHLECQYDKKIIDLKGREDEIERQKDILLKQSEDEKREIEIKMNEEIQKLESTLLEQKLHEKTLEEENKVLIERLQKDRDDFQQRLEEVSSSKDLKLNLLEKQLQEKERELKAEVERLESLRLREAEDLQTAREREIHELRENMKIEQESKIKHIESLQLQMKMQEHLTKETSEMAKKEFQDLIESLKKEAEDIRTQMNEQLAIKLTEQAELESARRTAEDKLERERKLLEERLHEREKEKQQLKELLLEKNKQSEQDLQKLQKELAEKEASVREQLAIEKERLASILAQKTETCNSTIEAMQQELQEVTSKMNTAQEIIDGNKAKDPVIIDLTNVSFDTPSTSNYSAQMIIANEEKAHVLENVNKIMESELQCSICADLFIEATSLNCSHTFCKHCIETWKKKKIECPVCRAKITSECRSIVLDSFIEKMVDSMDDETKQKRAQTLLERQMLEVVARVTHTMIPPTTASSARTRTTMNIPTSALGIVGGIMPNGVIVNLRIPSSTTLRGRGSNSRATYVLASHSYIPPHLQGHLINPTPPVTRQSNPQTRSTQRGRRAGRGRQRGAPAPGYQ